MTRRLSMTAVLITVISLTLPPAGLPAADLSSPTRPDANLEPHLESIHSVGRQGQGNEAASEAVQALSSGSTADILPILASFEGASPLAANYLRNAVETIADRALESDESIPAEQLEAFILDIERDPRARRLAFEVLKKVDPSAEERLIPGMLRDPSPEFRRDAVTRLIDQAETLEESDKKSSDREAVALYRKALTGATDADLVKDISKALKKHGEDVNVVRHFGFLTGWRIIGPFDNRDGVGFDRVYPPEESLDFSATLKGKEGEVRWQKITTDDRFGIIDIAESIAPHKGAVMYLATTFESDRAREIEFRLGTPNAWKLWLNGEYLFGRDEYHRGMAIDQYQVPAKLKAGNNVILLKLCQNEQTQDWAQRYQIQIRVCDPSGVAVLPGESKTAAVSE